jgi:hypothetical protein
MYIEKTLVCGFEPALRGMRNPMESWIKSDTIYDYAAGIKLNEFGQRVPEWPRIGENDMKCIQDRFRPGTTDERKFIRQIIIWADFLLPIDLWSEADTYKVATVRDSCSTMHKLGHRDLAPMDFEKEDVDEYDLSQLNAMGKAMREKLPFIDSKTGKRYEGLTLLEHMKHRLPSGYIQRATYMMSYETAINMYRARRHHRLPQWSGPDGICAWIRSLPYMAEFLPMLGL